MHEIMKLDELKTILEKQVEAGGDGTIAQKQVAVSPSVCLSLMCV